MTKPEATAEAEHDTTTDLVGEPFRLTKVGDERLSRIIETLNAKETANGDKPTPRGEFLAGMLEAGIGFYEVEKGLGLTPHESQALARPLPPIPGLVRIDNPDAITDDELRAFIAWVDAALADARSVGRDAIGVVGASSVQIAGSYEAIVARGIPCTFEVRLSLDQFDGRKIAQAHIRAKDAP